MSDPKYKNIGTLEDRLIEECSELTKALCKAKRFGYDNHHPLSRPEDTNCLKVLSEMLDVECCINDLRRELDADGRKRKLIFTCGNTRFARWKCQKCGLTFKRVRAGEPRSCPCCKDKGVKSFVGEFKKDKEQ